MRYLALACDYDGTLASEGRVASETVSVLERLLASGRKLILVTGRELGDLQSVFSRLDLFEWVVTENGALIYRPADKFEKVLVGKDRCMINDIRPLDTKQMKADRKLMRDQMKKAKAAPDA